MAEEIVSKTIQSGFKSQGEHQTSFEVDGWVFDFEKMLLWKPIKYRLQGIKQGHGRTTFQQSFHDFKISRNGRIQVWWHQEKEWKEPFGEGHPANTEIRIAFSEWLVENIIL